MPIEGKKYWEISGNYKDESELDYLELWYSIDGNPFKITILASDLDDNGIFSIQSEIPNFLPNGEIPNTENAYFFMGIYVDENGNLRSASSDDLAEMNSFFYLIL